MPSSPSMDTPTARGIHGSDQPVTKARPQTHQPIHLSKSKLTRPQHPVHRQRGSTRHPSDLHYLPATIFPVQRFSLPGFQPFPTLSTPVIGGGGRDRTDDPLLAKQVLSQLSYAPISACHHRHAAELVGQGGLEPPTPRLSSVCSNQLSY